MQNLNHIIKDKHMSYVRNKTQHMSYVTYEGNDVDEAVDKFKHLRSNESDYRKLHCWYAYRLGVDRYCGLAAEAESNGKDPARYFSWLLKDALKVKRVSR